MGNGERKRCLNETVGAARPSAPQSSNIKSGIAKGVRSTVNDPATRPEEEEGERERKRTRKRKRKRTLRFEKVLLPTRSSLIQAGSSGSKSFCPPQGRAGGKKLPLPAPLLCFCMCHEQFMLCTIHVSHMHIVRAGLQRGCGVPSMTQPRARRRKRAHRNHGCTSPRLRGLGSKGLSLSTNQSPQPF